MMMPGRGGMPMNGQAGGAGIPDSEGSSEMIDPSILQAMLAGALPGGGMDAGMGMPCPSCGSPTAGDGSCPTCGMPAADSGPGAMDPGALAALLGQPGAQAPSPDGVDAVGPPGDSDTTGADPDQASLQQLLAMLSMIQGGQSGMSPGMAPGAGGGMPPQGGGGAPPGAQRPNPLTAAMGRG